MLSIVSFEVVRLHDVYTYDLSLFDNSGSRDISILYGDNGSGKTTLLKVLYHLLSSSGDRGHLTALSKIPFHRAKAILSDGTVVSVERASPPSGFPMRFSIARPNEIHASYHFVPERYKAGVLEEVIDKEIMKKYASAKAYRFRNESHNMRTVREAILENFSEAAHNAYCEALKKLSITIYFLGTERRILSDAVEQQWSAHNSRDQLERPEEQIAMLRAAYLRDALQRGARYLNRQIIQASNAGSKNVNDIFADIFRRIVRDDKPEPDKKPRTARALAVNLRWLQRRQRNFVKLGMSPDLDVGSFIADLKVENGPANDLVAKVLEPFIATIRARLDAMEPIRESIAIFVSSLNGFLKYKSIDYHPSTGFVISGPLGEPLDVQHLSSGEQQLLLIFCSVLAANETPNIFIIDEPEISLNVKWQRELLGALRKISSDAKNQLLISTHSIELLTQHSESIVALDPLISRNTLPLFSSEDFE